MFKITQEDTGVEFSTRPMKCDPRLPGVPSMLGCRSGHQSLFCGPSGSGKTSIVMALLMGKHLYRKVFDTILVFMPPSSRASLPNKVLENLEHPPFDELNLNTLSHALEIIEENAAEDPPLNSLILFDDVTASLKDNSILREMVHLSFSRRHLRCSIWMLSQTLVSIPLQLRKNFTHLYLFKPRNFKELEHLFSEYTSSRAEAEALTRAVWQEPHDVLLLHTDTGDRWRISNSRVYRLRMGPA